MKKRESISFDAVLIRDGFLSLRQEICLEKTIPACIAKTVETGRIAAYDLGNPRRERHIFWDSDVAKVLEGIAYALKLRPDGKLQRILEDWIKRIVSVQTPDGYLNSCFTGENAGRRWDQLCVNHQLYCAGHLMEAAVAARDLPGGKLFLESVCRYADHIAARFGTGKGQRRGWPGHEEIELALVKLYRATGKDEYFKLAKYFIDDRGTEPNVFLEEGYKAAHLKNLQADRPVRQQTEASGHAVRLVYLLAGIADAAAETDDRELLAVAEQLADNLCNRRMYITGGIGSSFSGEAVTRDYDLTNGSLMYAESCAAMGLAQAMRRLFNLTGKNCYADVMERTLYNAVPAGIGLAGDTFFYTNYLEVDESTHYYNAGAPERQPWFRTSCCPTSFCRFLPQLGTFLYSVSGDEIFLLIPAANTADLVVNGRKIRLEVDGKYPYDGRITVTIRTAGKFKLNCRIPSWCRNWRVSLNGQDAKSPAIDRCWRAGDTVELFLDMPVEFMRANQKITADLGKVALMRGPLVYAFEEIDQAHPVREMLVDTARPVIPVPAPGLPEGTVALRGGAVFEELPADDLYTTARPEYAAGSFTAGPYALWQNRGRSNMCVWIRSGESALRD